MQNKSTITALWLKIMKVTAIHIYLTLLLTGTVMAHSSAQELLNRSITLSCDNMELKKLLERVGEVAKVPITYNSGILPKTHRVSVNFNNKNLADVLNQLLTPLGISYVIVLDQIILRKEKRPELLLSPRQSSTESVPEVLRIVGSVRDEKGDGLPGVNVVLKGTQQGTVTNTSGNFEISVPNEQASLIFSFLGYLSQEIRIGSRRTLTVSMVPDEKSLDEVVVIGYGEVNRKDLTGSVGSANVVDMVKAPVASFDQALAGRVAGVQVSANDGQPGSLPNIIIRGASSITQDNSPLYVVDGFPIERNDNNAINPADIESIDILKDASATAIYGARGANGVIMITTKRGKLGKPVIAYSGYYGFQKDQTRKMEVLSPYEFVRLQLEIDNTNATTKYLYGGKTLESYRNVQGIDWQGKVFRQAPMQNHNLSISGGTAKSKYSISGSLMDQDGIIINSGFRRYQGRLTLDQEISDQFKVGVMANYSNSKNFGTIVNGTPGSISNNILNNLWSFRPLITDNDVDIESELFDPEVFSFDPGRVNPVIQLQNELRESYSANFLSNFYAEYKILNGLKLRVSAGASGVTIKDLAFNNTKTRTGNPLFPQTLGINGSTYYSENTSLSNENTLSYSRTFTQNHHVNILAGYSQQRNNTSSFGAEVIQAANESLGISGLDEGAPRSVRSTSSVWSLQSFLGRANYSFKSKFLLTASIRADGSSKFAKGNQWGYFPSGAFAYRLSDEAFIKKIPIVSDAKLRISYGATGNNRVGDFASLSSIVFGNTNMYPFGNTTPTKGGAPSSLGNPHLKWETTRQFNVGLDVGLWNDRLLITTDYYHKKTTDLLLNAELPAETGYLRAFKNIGSVSNSGIELTISSINITNKNFKWNTNLNISFNRNKLLALTDGQESLTSGQTGGVFQSRQRYIAKVGQPIAMFWGVIFDGLYQPEDFNVLPNGSYVLKDEIPANGTARSIIRPGHIKFKDINFDGTVNEKDFTVIGNPNPDFIGGLTNNLTYKGFDLNVFFQFSYGNDILNANRIMFEGINNFPASKNMFATYANRWSEDNMDTDIPSRIGRGPEYISNHMIEDGSFLRLKTVSLGYTFPNINKYVKTQAIRAYVSAQNLYTWTNYSGPDPEVSVRHSTLTPGLDFSPYPIAQTLIFGLNITL